MSEFYFTELASVCQSKLSEAGFRIHPVENLGAINEIAGSLGKPYTTPRLLPFFNDFTPNNSFWLTLTQDGETIAAGGCRFDDLGGMPLSAFWRNCVARYYEGTEGSLVDVAPPVDDALSGRLAYFGDLIVKEGFRGQLAGAVLKRFTHFAIAFAMLKFNPDATYAFIRERDVGRGAMKFYGFNSVIHNAQSWHNPPDYHRDDDACLYVTKSYFSYYAKLMINSPEKL